MKRTLVVAFSFLAFLTNLPSGFSDDAVFDISGNPVVTDRRYYILPAIRGPQGGGLKLAKTGNSQCPLTVLQDYSEVFRGSPVKFTVAEPTPLILTDSSLDIEFVDKPECAESPKWIVFLDNEIYTPYVGLSGQTGPILDGKFKIEKQGLGYKLVFCVDDSQNCFDIGRSDAQNGEDGRRLSFTQEDVFNVVFVQAFEDDDKVIKSVV